MAGMPAPPAPLRCCSLQRACRAPGPGRPPAPPTQGRHDTDAPRVPPRRSLVEPGLRACGTERRHRGLRAGLPLQPLLRPLPGRPVPGEQRGAGAACRARHRRRGAADHLVCGHGGGRGAPPAEPAPRLRLPVPMHSLCGGGIRGDCGLRLESGVWRGTGMHARPWAPFGQQGSHRAMHAAYGRPRVSEIYLPETICRRDEIPGAGREPSAAGLNQFCL